uniref:VWFA domain-containing protein n=1 Tax=viral metagenome TaxID=1070528 RepID=A0A6C0ARC3_9ZZZZ
MAALVSALDNYTPQQIGENGHVEYGWSNSTQEQILQLSFQLIRTDENGINNLKTILRNLLLVLYQQVSSGNIVEKQIAKGHLSLIYKMIGQTRDVVDGKGEYALTYMMIYTWYEFFPALAHFALKCLVDLGEKHQYGSWKDIKYFCEYCKSQGCDIKHGLVQYAIQLINDQLKKDLAYSGNLSLTAKWVPREKSQFKWIYAELATNYFPEYMATADTSVRLEKAVLKCKTEYRKMISSLNKRIDTLQIKQCGKNWAAINFNKVTSISLGKQKKAFLNVNKKGDIRFPDDEDRIECAEHFNAHIQKAVKGEIEMKGKRVGMAYFTKQARQLNHGYGSQVEKDLVNSQWRDNSKLTGALENFIAMVDISGSMTGDPMDVAIALGIRIAEKSKLGKRVMTFSMNPKWINLEPYPDFVSQVMAIEGGEVGYNTNFYKALDLILDAIILNKMDPLDVQNMVLVMLSDMAIDQAETYQGATTKDMRTALFETIKQKYAAAGMRVHGAPYKPPHILFWNLRSTSGFPCMSNEPGVSMVAGFSPALLNDFCDKGMDAILSLTPWSQLVSSLSKDRYQILEDYLDKIIEV